MDTGIKIFSVLYELQCTDYHQGRVNLLLMHIFIQSLYNYNDDLGHDDVT